MIATRTTTHIILVSAIVACLAGAYVLRNAGIDDVGVSYRYARHMAEGAGLAWNAGEEPVEGYSNLLWVLMLASGHLFGADIEVLSRVLGLAFGLATLLLVHRLALSLLDERQQAAAPLVPLLVALTPAWIMWIMSGLEIALYSLLLVLAVYALTLSNRAKTVTASIALSLLILTRPEAIGLAIGYLGVVWMTKAFAEQAPLRGVGIPLLAVIGTVAAVTVFRLAYYGYPLPNTVYAKFSTLFPSAKVVGLWVLYIAPILLIWMATARGWWRSRARAPMLCAIVLVVVQTLQVLPVNPVMHFLHRYTIAFVPLLYLPVPLVLTRLSARSRMVAVAGLGILAAWIVSDWPSVLRYYDANDYMWRRQQCVIEKLQSLPGSPRIAMIDAGRIPFRTDLPSIDAWGLCDRRIGHEGFSARYLLEHPHGAPDAFIFALRDTPAGLEIVFGTDKLVKAEPEFAERYALWQVCSGSSDQKPAGHNPYWYLEYGIYLRRDYANDL